MNNAAHRTCRMCRRGITRIEWLVLLFLAFCALSGLALANLWAAERGQRLTEISGALGMIAGGAAGVLAIVLFIIPCDLFQRWWRPFPPPCESGTCRRRRDYTLSILPEADPRIGSSRLRWTCRCGHVYAETGSDDSQEVRWVCVLSDGGIRPYLKHTVGGRWRPDQPGGTQ